MGTWTARIVKAWPAAASAALLFAAFPPLNFGLLVFVALAPWIVSLRNASNWGAVRSGYVFGLIYMAAQMAWLQTLTGHWLGSFGLSLIPWALSALIGALYFAVAGWLIRLCLHQNRLWLIPIAWVGIEVFRSFVPGLAFPWGLIATPLWSMPFLIQDAFFGTIYLVSAWVVLANVIVATILEGGRYVAVRVHATVWVLLLTLSFVRYTTPAEGRSVKVAIGQPGVDLAFLDSEDQKEQLAENGTAMLNRVKLIHPDLVVMPEGLTRAGDSMPPEIPFIIPKGVSVLFGGQRGKNPTYQSAFGYDGKWSYADKKRLVVFGEYVPGRNWIPWLDKFQLPSGDLTASDKVSAVDVNGIRVGPLLCFEGLFADVAQNQVQNKAQLLAVMAVDDWYVGTAAPEQLKCAAIWRAVETGLPVVRAATQGYSLAADARGNVLGEAPFGKPICFEADLKLPAEPESMPIRPWIMWLFPLLCPAIWVLDRFAPKQSDEPAKPRRAT